MASHCAEENALTKRFTALRMLAVAAVVFWRVRKVFKADFNEGSNIIVRFVKAGCFFALHEGLGMLLYFSIAFGLDTTTVFFAPDDGLYCEANKLVALYTVALLSFLPNAFYSLRFQSRYWDNASTLKRIAFIIGVIALTSMTFYIRLKLVFAAGWISVVQHTLSGLSVTMRAVLASAIPPMVDVIQSAILIGVTHIKRGPTVDRESLLPTHGDPQQSAPTTPTAVPYIPPQVVSSGKEFPE